MITVKLYIDDKYQGVYELTRGADSFFWQYKKGSYFLDADAELPTVKLKNRKSMKQAAFCISFEESDLDHLKWLL